MFPIFVTFSNSSICSPSQMTLPTVENSRLEHVKVLFWHQTSLIALVSFSNEQKLSKATWDSAGLHTLVQTGRMPRRPWRKRFAHERKRFAQKGKDLHRKETICTERKRFAHARKSIAQRGKVRIAHRATVSHFEGNVCWEHPHLGYWQFFSFWYY